MNNAFGSDIECKVKYDNRFGYNEYLNEALWICNPDQVGEVWRFAFPNGLTVSVARTAGWDYHNTRRNLGCTYGFSMGLYSVVVYPTEKGMFYSIADYHWKDHEEVKVLLETTKNSPTERTGKY